MPHFQVSGKCVTVNRIQCGKTTGEYDIDEMLLKATVLYNNNKSGVKWRKTFSEKYDNYEGETRTRRDYVPLTVYYLYGWVADKTLHLSEREINFLVKLFSDNAAFFDNRKKQLPRKPLYKEIPKNMMRERAVMALEIALAE